MMNDRICILGVDDHALVHEGIPVQLPTTRARYATYRRRLKAREHKPKVTLMDLTSGIERIAATSKIPLLSTATIHWKKKGLVFAAQRAVAS
jgi:hypothetical protein